MFLTSVKCNELFVNRSKKDNCYKVDNIRKKGENLNILSRVTTSLGGLQTLLQKAENGS